MTNQVNNQRHTYHLLKFHNSLDSEDELLLRLLKHQSKSPQTVLLRTTLTRMIIIYVLMTWLLGSNYLHYYCLYALNWVYRLLSVRVSILCLLQIGKLTQAYEMYPWEWIHGVKVAYYSLCQSPDAFNNNWSLVLVVREQNHHTRQWVFVILPCSCLSGSNQVAVMNPSEDWALIIWKRFTQNPPIRPYLKILPFFKLWIKINVLTS